MIRAFCSTNFYVKIFYLYAYLVSIAPFYPEFILNYRVSPERCLEKLLEGDIKTMCRKSLFASEEKYNKNMRESLTKRARELENGP